MLINIYINDVDDAHNKLFIGEYITHINSLIHMLRLDDTILDHSSGYLVEEECVNIEELIGVMD